MIERDVPSLTTETVPYEPIRRRHYSLPRASHETLNFLRDVVASGAHLDLEARRRNLIGVYYGSPATLENLQEMARSTSRKGVRQLIISGMKEMWQNLPLNLQEKHTKEEVIQFKKRFNQQARTKMSDVRKAYWQTPKYRRKVTVAVRGKSHSTESKELMSSTSRRSWKNPEYRKRIIEANQEKWLDPEFRTRMVQMARARVVTPETRMKLSNTLKEKWQQDTEFRTRLDEAREKARNPESRSKMSEARRRFWQNPESRSRMIEAIKAGWERKRSV